MITAKGKIKKGKRKTGGSWLIASDGRNVGHIKTSATEQDAEVAQLVGANGHGVLEHSIHSGLDRQGVPCEDREVKVDLDNIAVELLYGWNLPSTFTREKRGIDQQ